MGLETTNRAHDVSVAIGTLAAEIARLRNPADMQEGWMALGMLVEKLATPTIEAPSTALNGLGLADVGGSEWKPQ